MATGDELFRLLVQSVRDYAIFLLDPTGHISSWNAGAEHIKGYRASEIIGHHFSIFYPRKLAEAGVPDRELEDAIRDGRFEDEGWRVRKDGSMFWANVIITPVRDASGTLRGFAKVTRDLTERRLAENELRQSEERYRLLVEGIPDYAIYLLSPEGRIASWNAGAQRLKGYPADEVIGEHFSMFYPPEAVAAQWPQRELKIALAQGRLESDGWRVRKDGSRFWANVVITALYDHQGNHYGFSKITRDITERRNYEVSMQALNTELKLRVAQLGEANRTLAFKSAENEAFLYSVSHDVRGPLVNLQGFGRELERAFGELAEAVGGAQLPASLRSQVHQLLGEDIAESVRYIQTAVRHLSAMVDGLLRVSRAGRVTYRSERVDVHSLLERVIDSMKGTIADAGAEVSLLEVPPAQSDPGALEQIFGNLVNNALQYRDPSRASRIEIGALSPADGARAIVYYVRDNGMGIAERGIPRLFTPFQRLHPDAGPGEGIGLAMVRRMLDRLQGSIRVESRFGSGTTFFVELPHPSQTGAP